MSNLVIVAIPEEQDRVWKVSSEQVPHLTLLFLGDADSNPHVEMITQFVEHAAEVSEHGPFYLEVDRRGTLGPDEADVLFFSERNRNLRWVKQFRGQLLQNQQIRSAYDSTQQYDEWEPHLTLGYPDTPANPVPDDGFAHPFYSVCFDRIAVWNLDYEGPDFRLEWPEREFEGDLAVAYSDTQKAALTHYATNFGMSEAEVLEHYGVKGMRWGKTTGKVASGAAAAAPFVSRRARNTAIAIDLGKKAAPKLKAAGQKIKAGAKGVGNLAVKIGDAHFEGKAEDGKTFMRVHNKAAENFNAHDIPKINNKGQYRDADFNVLGPQAKLTKQYDAEMADAFNARLHEAVKKEGTNWSGTRKLEIDGHYANPDGWGLKVVDTGAKHAAVAATAKIIFVPLKRDAKGFITDTGDVELIDPPNAMKQTADLGREFLEHSVLDNSTLAEQIKAKVQSILDDVKGDNKDAALFGDPLIQAKIRSVLQDFYQDPNVDNAVVYDALGEVFLEHYGIKGMRWGFRRSGDSPSPVSPSAASKVPQGNRRKTKIKTEGGQNHPAHEDAIKVAEAKAKLKKSGPAALSNNELRNVANRVQLENQVALLTSHKGKQFVTRQLQSESQNLARAGVREGFKRGVKRGAKTAGAAAAVAA